MRPESVVQKIWNLCHILRGDGVSYHQYVSELTYLLFLKIAEENGTEGVLPSNCRWGDLVGSPDNDLLGFYQEMLTHLGTSAESEIIRSIYAFPTTVFSHAVNLRAVISGIAKINWHDVEHDRFGQIYEGLVEKSAQDVRSGAGQYFTPRALVTSIVEVMKPKIGEMIQDPATGSGGFLIASDRYIRDNSTREEYDARPPHYQGVEIEKNTRRMCLMNVFLNGLDAKVVYGDALTDDATQLDLADLILANPPFGSKAGSRRPARADLPFPTANKQLAFLQHIYLGLNGHGRAAVVLPDNVLFEDGIARLVRADLMKRCNLHTIMRLPRGIFSSAGVKTNVLFFSKEKNLETREIWFYDLRTNMGAFGKTSPLKRGHFEDFIRCFGADPYGRSPRTQHGDGVRFRCYSRQEVFERDDNLDISWLREEGNEENLTAPEDVAAAILSALRAATIEIEAVAEELSEIGRGDN